MAGRHGKINIEETLSGEEGSCVPDLTAQGDVGEDVRVSIDAVQGVHHGLHSLDAILLTHGTAFPLVDLGHTHSVYITSNLSRFYFLSPFLAQMYCLH